MTTLSLLHQAINDELIRARSIPLPENGRLVLGSVCAASLRFQDAFAGQITSFLKLSGVVGKRIKALEYIPRQDDAEVGDFVLTFED